MPKLNRPNSAVESEALNDAYKAEFCILFHNYVSGVVEGDAQAVDEFLRGLRATRECYVEVLKVLAE